MIAMETVIFKVEGIPVPQPREDIRIVDYRTKYVKRLVSLAEPDAWDLALAQQWISEMALETRPAFPNHFIEKDHAVWGFKRDVAAAWTAATDQPPFEGPVGIRIVFVTFRPQVKRWKKKPMPREWDVRLRTGDFDNLAKSTCDALEGKAWHNDKQISQSQTLTVMASGSESPHLLMQVRELSTDEEPQPPIWCREFQPAKGAASARATSRLPF